MKWGGKFHYRPETKRSVRLMQVLVAPILTLYATLLAMSALPNTQNANTLLSYTISSSWLLISLYYFFKEAANRRDEAIRMAVVHLLAIAIFVYSIGYSQPFAPLFGLLMVGAYLVFGRIGLFLSIFSFSLGAILSLIVTPQINYVIIYNTFASVVAVTIMAVAVIAIMSLQETRQSAFRHSQERARLQYDRMVTVINNLRDAAFSVDSKGGIITYNAACLDLLDTNDSLRGKSIQDLFKLTNADNNPVNFSDILDEATRSIRRDDLNMIYKDGESIMLELTISPIRSSYSVSKKDQELGGFIIMARDITKQKSLEEQRDEFISIVSHELRTPITIVEGTLSNLELMMKQPNYFNNKALSQTVTTAHDQVIYLAKMVNDLSTLSRAERGVADTAELINVTDMLQAMHRQYETEALQKKLHLNLELGQRLGNVLASRLYLEELLQNLITNGIKYTKKGSVTIVAERDNGKIVFAVTDTGLGISRSDQQKIFNKFYRSEDYRIRETGGTGLGLYVSAKLAKKLQTKIELKSHLNYGSTFSFELPVSH